jgi:hypothetical protein
VKYVLLAVATLLAGCAEPSCDREPPLEWDSWGDAFLSDYCNGCHSVLLGEGDRQDAPIGVDFNTYGDAITWSDRIQARVVAGDMPPAGGPNEEERALLDEWITCRVEPDKATLP